MNVARDGGRLAMRASIRGTLSSKSGALRQRTAFVCLECRHNSLETKSVGHLKLFNSARRWQEARRSFSSTLRRRQDDLKSRNEALNDKLEKPGNVASATPNGSNGTIQATKHKQLPSRREEIRSQITKHVNKFMDDLMPKLALASQRINTYTGTDYSAIESLRKEIRDQEQLVKDRHQACETAKESLEQARIAETQSRKEVVALLERRHSWSDTDLERYMSLIRSEHLSDQAVQSAKDALSNCETSLANARNKLERMERMQYHEEQIWSDTIRRNSTWVTFGLMGVNILLLLVTMGVVEPWRRRRMVREIKGALEENMAASATGAAHILAVASSAPVMQEVMSKKEFEKRREVEELLDQRNAEKVVEQLGVPKEVVEAKAPWANDPSVETTTVIDGDEPVVTSHTHEESGTIPAGIRYPLSEKELDEPIYEPPRTLEEKAKDLFSDRMISVRRIDVSTIALESAAAGALLTAIIMALLRPR